MNLILLEPHHLGGDGTAALDARQIKHLTSVQNVAVGDELRVGLLNGLMGSGIVESVSDAEIVLRHDCQQPPPPPLPLTVLLALPRPKMVKRSLQHLTTLGVKSIILLNSYRVEKSFWQSPWLTPEKIHEQLILGLEQAKDTVLPQVVLEKRFKPYVEDRLPALMQGKRGLVAHPVGGMRCPHLIDEPAVLAIGPEGGFIPYEVEKLEAAGFERIHLGERILRVETAVTALASKLYD